jgi:Glycosyl transferase family 2
MRSELKTLEQSSSGESEPSRPRHMSIAIFAWNEEAAIVPLLRSLFRQTLFDELERRDATCEILCVLNGCTDRTAEVAREFLDVEEKWHPDHTTFSCRVVNLPERGKTKAWNQFVHHLSAREARFLFMMDADILIHEEETLRSMLLALEKDPGANVSTDRPRKDLEFKARRSFRRRFSLTATEATLSAPAQLCGQLYCIRAEVARNIYLPLNLAACEDGFIKAAVCTDFATHAVEPGRVKMAPRAEHTFEAYTSPAAIFKNQKRQIIGQTMVHLLMDCFMPTLTLARRQRLAETLQELESTDPQWLKRLLAEHLRRTRFFWKLYPGLLGHRVRRLARLTLLRRLLAFPYAAASLVVELGASFIAWRALKNGCTDYWPRAERTGLGPTQTPTGAAARA